VISLRCTLLGVPFILLLISQVILLAHQVASSLNLVGCYLGSNRHHDGRKGAESALIFVSSLLPLPFLMLMLNLSLSSTLFVILICSLICWVGACHPAEQPIMLSIILSLLFMSSLLTEIRDGDLDKHRFIIGFPITTL